MEFVDGPTLALRIKQRSIPMAEVLLIAKQIAEGLEYAHERGIVHRDLKPANVKLTNDDRIKILDFGLAKAIQGEATASDIADSPTISQMATQAGVLLGTAAYMSPEQAKAKPVDRRADFPMREVTPSSLLISRRARPLSRTRCSCLTAKACYLPPSPEEPLQNL